MSAEERCFECNRTFDEVAASGELCAGCFFSFDPDEMSAALNAKDAATRSRVFEYRGPVAAPAPTGGREMDKKAAGWWWPEDARKAHWFAEDNGRSACGRWLYRGFDVAPDGEFRDSDCCATCKRERRVIIARNTGAIDDEATQEAER